MGLVCPTEPPPPPLPDRTWAPSEGAGGRPSWGMRTVRLPLGKVEWLYFAAGRASTWGWIATGV